MHRSIRAGALIALVSLTIGPRRAAAQAAHSTFNFAGGWAVPTGDYGTLNQSGFALIGGLGINAPGSPIRFRAEASYNQFNHKDSVDPFGGSSRAGGFTGNAIYDFPMSRGSGFTPYAIGGIGLYGTRDFDDEETAWNVGWNLGGGIRFPLTGFSVYVEARYHSISAADVAIAPIVFGVQF
jgi:opacity protein-like surface antigen